MEEGAEQARAVLTDSIGLATGAVKLAQNVKEFVINVLVADALLIAGLEVEPFAPLTERVLADAIAKKIEQEYGLKVGDLLDAESVKRNLRSEALRVVGDRLGVGGSVRDIADALKARVREELKNAARNGDVDVLEAIGVGQRAIDDAERAAKADYASQQARNFSAAAEKNRERQARYRAAHRRKWVLK
jgi:hypothetical protein